MTDLGDMRLADMLEVIAAAVADHLAAPAQPAAAEPYLDAAAAAAYLSAPTSRVYDLAASGRLRVVKDGRRVLTRASWIDEYLEGREAA